MQLVRKIDAVPARNLGQKEAYAPCFGQQTCRVRSGSEGRLSVKMRLVSKSRCKSAPQKCDWRHNVRPDANATQSAAPVANFQRLIVLSDYVCDTKPVGIKTAIGGKNLSHSPQMPVWSAKARLVKNLGQLYFLSGRFLLREMTNLKQSQCHTRRYRISRLEKRRSHR